MKDKILLISCLFALFIFIFLLIILVFIYPAYVSMAHYNGEKAILEKYLIDFKGGGVYYPKSDKIVLYENNSIALRHELCHKDYTKRFKIINDSLKEELICYVKQYFIWKKVNLTTLDWSSN